MIDSRARRRVLAWARWQLPALDVTDPLASEILDGVAARLSLRRSGLDAYDTRSPRPYPEEWSELVRIAERHYAEAAA